MSEQYMATVIYQRLEELRSDVFWGWTKARVDEIKELFDEYLSSQVGERKGLFLKIAELEEKVRVLEGQVKFKEKENEDLLSACHQAKVETRAMREGNRVFVRDVIVDLCDHFGLEIIIGDE